MSGPIVFISTHKIKAGKLDAFRGHIRAGAESMKANKPHTVAFLPYLNEDGSEVSIVHVFPDAEAMEAHMEGVGDRAKRAAEFLDFHLLEVYGTPSDSVLQMMQQAPDSGVTFRLRPEHLSGYLRLGFG
jgi:quinol monooxygenase YgiN